MMPTTPKYVTSVSGEYKRTICALSACATASLKNQMLIICALNAFGASFEVTESPIGEISISPQITSAQLMISQSGLTFADVPKAIPGIIIQTNEIPAKNSPYENLTGDDGCLLPSFVHSLAKNGT